MFGTESTAVIVASESPVVPTSVPVDRCADATTESRASTDPFRTSTLIGADIIAESGSCGPRVVIEFNESGDLPAWGIQYTTDPVTDTLTSKDVSLAGAMTLTMTLGAWMGVFGVGYTGPNDIIVADVPGLRELRLINNTKGTSSWAIGLDAEVPFTVTEETNPSRIVVQFVPLG